MHLGHLKFATVLLLGGISQPALAQIMDTYPTTVSGCSGTAVVVGATTTTSNGNNAHVIAGTSFSDHRVDIPLAPLSGTYLWSNTDWIETELTFGCSVNGQLQMRASRRTAAVTTRQSYRICAAHRKGAARWVTSRAAIRARSTSGNTSNHDQVNSGGVVTIVTDFKLLSAILAQSRDSTATEETNAKSVVRFQERRASESGTI